MRWWKRLWSDPVESPGEPSQRVRLTLPGWREDTPAENMRVWRSHDGDTLTLAVGKEAILDGSNEMELRRRCRELAQHRDGGLIQARALDDKNGSSITLIYKRHQNTGYAFTGILITPSQERRSSGQSSRANGAQPGYGRLS